jgi:hypothetical protein
MQNQITASEEARRKEDLEYRKRQEEERRREREQRAEEERQYRERQEEEERKFRREIEDERRKDRERRDKEWEEQKKHNQELENQLFQIALSRSTSASAKHQTPKVQTEDEKANEEDTNEEEDVKEEDAKEEGAKEEVKQKETSQSPPLPPAPIPAQSSESGHQRSEEQDKEKRHVSGKKPAGKTLPKRPPSPPSKRSSKPSAKPGTPVANKTKLPLRSDPKWNEAYNARRREETKARREIAQSKHRNVRILRNEALIVSQQENIENTTLTKLKQQANSVKFYTEDIEGLHGNIYHKLTPATKLEWQVKERILAVTVEFLVHKRDDVLSSWIAETETFSPAVHDRIQVVFDQATKSDKTSECWAHICYTVLMQCDHFFQAEYELLKKLEEICQVETDLDSLEEAIDSFQESRLNLLEDADELSHMWNDPKLPLFFRLKTRFEAKSLLHLNHTFCFGKNSYEQVRQGLLAKNEELMTQIPYFLYNAFNIFQQERKNPFSTE